MSFNSQCALKGSSVVIKCEYDYPSNQRVSSVSWSKGQFVSLKWILFPLLNSDHFKYVGNAKHDCSLKINDVQPADIGAYFFRFTTNRNRWTSKTFVGLSVKGKDKIINKGKFIMN